MKDEIIAAIKKLKKDKDNDVYYASEEILKII
jgi:hypothetical protein